MGAIQHCILHTVGLVASTTLIKLYVLMQGICLRVKARRILHTTAGGVLGYDSGMVEQGDGSTKSMGTSIVSTKHHDSASLVPIHP